MTDLTDRIELTESAGSEVTADLAIDRALLADPLLRHLIEDQIVGESGMWFCDDLAALEEEGFTIADLERLEGLLDADTPGAKLFENVIVIGGEDALITSYMDAPDAYDHLRSMHVNEEKASQCTPPSLSDLSEQARMAVRSIEIEPPMSRLEKSR